MKNSLSILLLLLLPCFGFAQDSSTCKHTYEVNKVIPYVSVNVEQLKNAKSLIDLDKDYKPSWINEYISVEISTINQGKVRKAKNENDLLTKEQKENMEKADAGTEIVVNIQYIPENNLSHNNIQEHDIKFVVNPLVDAIYKGGREKMMQYLNENVIDKIPVGTYKGYDLIAAMFTVNKEGEIENVTLFDTRGYGVTENEEIDNLLLETIRKMPCWIPAEYKDGTKVEQDYVFTVGNHESCVTALLNIREY